ncbi:NAD(P)H-dependent oxidoreductase [Bdellovibrio bacteriovorus]|uniref:NAD(P)H-dependent oxidoreductase n=1 Tax=Bdellovibrio bacteriovorus TaxID=959 RepID=A0A150WET1_BDEBC|nr:NAD(P)H-dependent oxidoreductase [Bdellovibrio bacteriovorus]KYG61617.1 NAD(P)H-dependent oxidoreductase [Bdellovibrio bacteriovorus]
MSQTSVSDALTWRYAVKKYNPDAKISATDWKALTQSLLLAPSSYGLQPYKFIVVENPAVREKLKTVSWNQTQVTDASHYVVFLYKDNVDERFIQKYVDRIAEVRGATPESLEGFKAMMVQNIAQAPEEKTRVWAQRQAYIAMGFLLETAALLKVDATPMEGFDPAAYDNILGLEGSGWKTVASVALGYRHTDDAFQNLKKVRFAEDSVIEYVK